MWERIRNLQWTAHHHGPQQVASGPWQGRPAQDSTQGGGFGSFAHPLCFNSWKMSENVRNLCQALVAPWSCQLRGPRVATRLPRPGTRSTPDPPAPHGSCSSLRPCLLSLPRRAPRTSCHFSIFSREHIIQIHPSKLLVVQVPFEWLATHRFSLCVFEQV